MLQDYLLHCVRVRHIASAIIVTSISLPFTLPSSSYTTPNMPSPLNLTTTFILQSIFYNLASFANAIALIGNTNTCAYAYQTCTRGSLRACTHSWHVQTYLDNALSLGTLQNTVCIHPPHPKENMYTVAGHLQIL